MLGVLAILTGLWAEYRNRAGYKAGRFDGAACMLFSLRDKNLIDIDDQGIVKAKKTINEAVDVK
jgi:hypothetical protein